MVGAATPTGTGSPAGGSVLGRLPDFPDREAVPVSYRRYGGDLLSFTSGGWSVWWKNLRGGAPVAARVR